MIMSLIAQSTEKANFGGGFQPPTKAYSENSLTTDGVLSNLELFISNIIGFLTVLAGLFFIFYFILAAFNWVTAGGEQSKLQKARDQMINGVIGLILIVAAYGVIGLIGSVIGLDLLNPADQVRLILPTTPAPPTTI